MSSASLGILITYTTIQRWTAVFLCSDTSGFFSPRGLHGFYILCCTRVDTAIRRSRVFGKGPSLSIFDIYHLPFSTIIHKHIHTNF